MSTVQSHIAASNRNLKLLVFNLGVLVRDLNIRDLNVWKYLLLIDDHFLL